MKKQRISVAEYLSQQIAISGVPQTEIAEALKYDKPNIITMFKQGKTKVPINKIAPLSKILGIDPVFFFRMVMSEYSPETLEVIESLIGKNIVTDTEQIIINLARQAAGGSELRITNDRMDELTNLFASWAAKDQKEAGVALDEYNKKFSRSKNA